MTEGPPGPHRPAPGTTTALTALWVAVTRAGGAVGLPADAPVEEIRATAVASLDEVRADRQEMPSIGSDAAQGWNEVGVFPGALRLGPGPGGLRDEHSFQLRLR